MTSFLAFFAIFSKMRPNKSVYILSLMKFWVARTFWVERHLDVVLEVFQVVGSKFLFYKTYRYLLTEKITMIALLMREILNFLNLEFRSQFEYLEHGMDYGTLISQEDSLKKLGWLIYKWWRYLTFQQLKKKKRVLEVWATKNFIKDKMTGRVDIVRCIFEKTAKNLKLK